MDFPLYPKQRQSLIFQYHGYKCREYGQYFTESIPEKIQHARISCRAAEWIKSLLSKNMSVSAVSEITGFNWETIKKIHLGIMDKFLKIEKMNFFVQVINLHILRLMNLQYIKAIVTLHV